MTVRKIDLFRYHDLTSRLAAFDTDGGAFIRGDREDLQIVDAEPAYRPGEREIARIAGVVELVGARSIPGSAGAPSLGLVLGGGATLVLTTERLIVMATSGASQLGRIADDEIQTFVLPWDLVDIIGMPLHKSLADRVAGARRITLFSALTVFHLDLVPFRQAEIDKHVKQVADEAVMAMLVRAAATHRLSVSPPEDHARLHGLIRGALQRYGEEWLAQITPDCPADEFPPHVRGRLAVSPQMTRHRHAAAALLLDG